MKEEQAQSPGQRRDYLLGQGANLTFTIAQAMAAVAVPILAVHSGHSPMVVGLIVALSAVSQTLARLGMGPMMSVFPTKYFITSAAGLLAVSCLILGLNGTLWAFITSQLLQGAARAYFWTGAQTHVVRDSASSVQALARLNIFQGVGQLIGPALAGVLGAVSLPMSLMVATGFAVLAIFPSFFLIRYEPFQKKAKAVGGCNGSLWANPGIRHAANMTGIAGAWRGILNSYVPVLLSSSGYSVGTIGGLVTATNLASLSGSACAGWAQRHGARFSLAIGGLTAGLGVAFVAFFPTPLVLAVLFLIASGWGAGLLQTVGPALAADEVDPEDRGRSIALIGTFRSMSLLISPLIGAGLLLVLPSVAVASGVAGIIVAAPALGAFLGSKPAE